MRCRALSQSCVLSWGLLCALHLSFQCCHSFSVMLSLETRAMGMVLGLVPTCRRSHLLVSCPFGSLYGLWKVYPGSLHSSQHAVMPSAYTGTFTDLSNASRLTWLCREGCLSHIGSALNCCVWFHMMTTMESTAPG